VSLRKGLIIFIILVFGGNALILFKTVDSGTIKTILSANKSYLVAALFLLALVWTLDTVRLCALARSAQENISFKFGMILTWINYFGGAVTPMQTGGGAFQVYAMYKRGIPIGKGIAITMIRTTLTLLLLSMLVPLSLLIDSSIIGGSNFIKGIVGYVFVVVFVLWTFIAFTIYRPDLIKKAAQGFALWLKRFKIIKKERILPWSRWISRETDNYTLNIKLSLSVGKWNFLFAAVCTVFHQIALLSILPCLMLAMGLPLNFAQVIITQAIFIFAIYFIPTPGASGVAEIGGAAVFTTLMAENMAGVMAIMWRFFTEYISILMGIITVIHMIGWGLSEDIYNKADKAEETPENIDNG
jgi:uncharacterized protein (TIRG00374 family)